MCKQEAGVNSPSFLWLAFTLKLRCSHGCWIKDYWSLCRDIYVRPVYYSCLRCHVDRHRLSGPWAGKGALPWSGPSQQRHGHPGTCSYRTWRGRRSWSQFHSWRRGAERHTAIGEATFLRKVFKLFLFFSLFSFFFVCFFALIWDSLPLLEGSPAKEESNLPLKDQQPGFRGQRTCSHSRLHSQQIYLVELKRLNNHYIMITFIF